MAMEDNHDDGGRGRAWAEARGRRDLGGRVVEQGNRLLPLLAAGGHGRYAVRTVAEDCLPNPNVL